MTLKISNCLTLERSYPTIFYDKTQIKNEFHTLTVKRWFVVGTKLVYCWYKCSVGGEPILYGFDTLHSSGVLVSFSFRWASFSYSGLRLSQYEAKIRHCDKRNKRHAIKPHKLQTS